MGCVGCCGQHVVWHGPAESLVLSVAMMAVVRLPGWELHGRWSGLWGATLRMQCSDGSVQDEVVIKGVSLVPESLWLPALSRGC